MFFKINGLSLAECTKCHAACVVLRNMCMMYGDHCVDEWIEQGVGVQRAA